MKLSKHDKQLIHNYGIKTTNNRKNDFFKTIEFLSWSFFPNASFFCEKDKLFQRTRIKNIVDIIQFYKENEMNTAESNKAILSTVYPINNNSRTLNINLYVNDYITKLVLLYSLGFENDFYWEQIEKELSKISYDMDSFYSYYASYNFLTNTKHLYNKFKDCSMQLYVVNKCILNIYYNHDKNKVNLNYYNVFSFCDVLLQLQSYADIFRPTSLLEEKLFNNMQRRIDRDIINMKIKGTWIARNK